MGNTDHVVRLPPLEAYLAISDLERSDGVARRRVDEIQRLVRLRPGARVLDAGAGQGWYSFLLSRENDVIAIDSSPWLVDQARKRAARLPSVAAPQLVVAPSQSLPVHDRSIDIALSLSGSIGHGSKAGDQATLCELCRVLAPEGRLVLETMHSEAAEERRERLAKFPAAWTVLYQPEFDRATQELRETQVLAHSGLDVGRFAYTMRIYDVDQILELLQDAGFATPAVYGGLDGSRVTRTSPVVLIARPQKPVFSAIIAAQAAGC